MDFIRIAAHAKINLTLAVLGRRADGYHELDTIMHAISLADTVEIEKADECSLVVEAGTAPLGQENLMMRAAAWFFSETGIAGSAVMRLWKWIPQEAGLGGGSADAAAVLRGLNCLYGNPFPLAEMARRAAVIGADVPFCVMGGAARCRGIGEILTPLSAWEGLPLLIVRPAVSVSTRAAYTALDESGSARENKTDAAEKALREKSFSALAAAFSNDFESALFPTNPALAKASAELKAFGFPTMMTGSGSAFFVLTPAEKREAVRGEILQRHPDWYAEAAETVSSEQ